jgi:hypothetical protein
MRQKILRRLTYANVMATIAVFLALGGAATIAATSICTGGTACVNSDDIINGQVRSADIGANQVATGKVLDNSLQGSDILDESLTGLDIGHSVVGEDEIAFGAVGSAEVLNDSLTAADIGPAAVRESELAPGAVTPNDFGTIPAARAQKTAEQSVPSSPSGLTALTFNSESFDTAALHSNSANTQNLTAPRSGVYQVSAGVVWNPSFDTNDRRLEIRSDSPTTFVASTGHRAASGASFTQQSASGLVKLAAGNVVGAFVNQNSGSTRTVRSDSDTFLAMTWVGPG